MIDIFLVGNPFSHFSKITPLITLIFRNYAGNSVPLNEPAHFNQMTNSQFLFDTIIIKTIEPKTNLLICSTYIINTYDNKINSLYASIRKQFIDEMNQYTIIAHNHLTHSTHPQSKSKTTLTTLDNVFFQICPPLCKDFFFFGIKIAEQFE